jgi:hypothetical protein
VGEHTTEARGVASSILASPIPSCLSLWVGSCWSYSYFYKGLCVIVCYE